MANNKAAFQKAMNQGHSAAWDQEWEKAAAAYSTALEEFPNHPQALSSLGLALYQMQDFSNALQCYQRAAAASPNDPIPQEKEARIYERMGRLDDAVAASSKAAELHLQARSAEKAIDNWLRILSIQPENTKVRARLANVYERLGKRDEAVAEFISLASVFQRANKLDQAVQAIEAANQLLPHNQEIRLAANMLRSNQPLPRPTRPQRHTGTLHVSSMHGIEDEADQEPDPLAETRQKATAALAAVLFEQTEDGALSSHTRARGLSALTRGIGDASNTSSGHTRITLHLGQAIESLTQNENQQAVVELEHALNLGLRQPAAYFILSLLTADDNPEKALKYLQQSINHPDYTFGSHLLFARIYENSYQWKEAAASYLHALALADAQVVPAEQADELIAHYDALIDSQGMVDDLSALQNTCKTVSDHLLRPGWRSYLAKARQQLPPLGDGMSPVPLAEMVLETRGGQVVDAMALVRQLAASGKVRTAMEEALYALQYAQTYMPLHILIGDLLLQDQHQAEAIRKFMVVVEMYTIRGEVNRAVRMLKRISQIQPSDLQIRQRLIEMLVSQGKTEEALAECSNLANLFYNLADLDKARQTYLEALKIAQKSEESRSWGVNLLLKVADIDMQRLNLRQALRIYEQIRTIQPENQTTRAQIVGLHFRLGQETEAMKELDAFLKMLENTGHRQQAIDFVSDLLIDHASQVDLRKRLADLYIHNGQLSEGVSQLDAVADMHMNANRHMEAVNMLETIISLEPPNVQEYRTALETLRRDMLRK